MWYCVTKKWAQDPAFFHLLSEVFFYDLRVGLTWWHIFVGGPEWWAIWDANMKSILDAVQNVGAKFFVRV